MQTHANTHKLKHQHTWQVDVATRAHQRQAAVATVATTAALLPPPPAVTTSMSENCSGGRNLDEEDSGEMGRGGDMTFFTHSEIVMPLDRPKSAAAMRRPGMYVCVVCICVYYVCV